MTCTGGGCRNPAVAVVLDEDDRPRGVCRFHAEINWLPGMLWRRPEPSGLPVRVEARGLPEPMLRLWLLAEVKLQATLRKAVWRLEARLEASRGRERRVRAELSRQSGLFDEQEAGAQTGA